MSNEDDSSLVLYICVMGISRVSRLARFSRLSRLLKLSRFLEWLDCLEWIDYLEYLFLMVSRGVEWIKNPMIWLVMFFMLTLSSMMHTNTNNIT